MLEIRIHGRGGQGAVTFAELLAQAADLAGWQAQAFPFFGVERRGAPVTSFVRLSKQTIRLRSQVYQPDYLIVLDDSLLASSGVKTGCKKTTKILVNQDSKKAPGQSGTIAVPATALAREHLGKPIVNTVLLGAFAGLSGLLDWSAVEKVIKHHFEEDLAEKNLAAARAGFAAVVKK